MNNELLLSTLPSHSRVWLYTSSRPLTAFEVSEIETIGNEFVNSWKAHGSALDAAIKVLYGQFILVAVDEQVAAVTGCSIDSSVNFIKETEKRFKITLLDKLNLGFRNSSQEVEVASMFEFQQKMDSNEINETTIVFNNMVETLGELRTNWEIPLNQSWHKQLL